MTALPDPVCIQRSDMSQGEVLPVAGGEVGVFSARSPDRTGPNEDAALIVGLGPTRAVLAVADGMGGGPAGDAAAGRALGALRKALRTEDPPSDSLRESILDGFEAANASVPRAASGAATTLAVAEIDAGQCRTYHVGDSAVVLTGQRGRIKHQTIAHSPTGYAIEAGLLNEDEALGHDDRHVVSNVVGSAAMKIEIGPTLSLAVHDTLVLASDGVFDNLRIEEIVATVRKGPLLAAVEQLASMCRARMAGESGAHPGKPDDVTFLLYRPLRR